MAQPSHRVAIADLRRTVLAPAIDALAVADEHNAPGTLYPRAQLPETVLYLTLGGAAVSTSRGIQNRCVRHGVLLMPGATPFTEQSQPHVPWRVRYILFRGPLADHFESAYWAHNRRVPEAFNPAPARWRQLISEMVLLLLDQPGDWDWQMLTRLTELLDAIRSAPRANQTEGLAVRAQRLVETHHDRAWTVPLLARELGVSTSLLTHRFKEATGQSTAQWVRQVRVTAAQRLLMQGVTVTEVAYRLRFSSPYHFSRFFKRETGRPPSAVRSVTASPLHSLSADSD